MSDPYEVVRKFENALCYYTGAKYAVTTTSCTMALLLACKWHVKKYKELYTQLPQDIKVSYDPISSPKGPPVNIPKMTYVSVPMSIIRAGGWPTFRDEDWIGEYQLNPYPIWDCARWFRADMYRSGQFMCCSFHWSKHLAIGQGGCILHDDYEADEWFRKARFDGRTEGVHPKDDHFNMIGYHCYMSPRDAAEGLSRLAVLPKHNDPLPNDDYPDLSTLSIFK